MVPVLVDQHRLAAGRAAVEADDRAHDLARCEARALEAGHAVGVDEGVVSSALLVSGGPACSPRRDLAPVADELPERIEAGEAARFSAFVRP